MGLTTFTSFHAPHMALTDLDFFTENFQRKKKKKVNVGIRTQGHPFVGASATTTGVPSHPCRILFKPHL